jgi:multiple antibiotic resistance protein
LGTVQFALLAITSIVAIMEPASTVAIYLALTKDMDFKKQRSVVTKSMKISFLVLAFFAVTGHLLFSIFNITVGAFKIAGGILLISVALGMLNPEKKEYSIAELEDIAVVPLAFPLTAGPGAITTVMLLVSEAKDILNVSFVFVGIAVGILLSYVALIYSSRLSRLLGGEGLRVVTRIISIIVLAIAVQFVINGSADAISQILSTIKTG